MEVSKVPILRAMRTISSLSMAITGRKMGRFAASSVEAMASAVWLATCPRHSPVTRHLAPTRSATRSAQRIMNRRMISVK